MTVLKEYTEGKTTFLTADVVHYTAEKGQPTTDMPIFYNPRMRVNRDLSVLALAAYSQKKPVNTICEPLAGSGVRSLRYLNEVEGDFRALLFDANPHAVETARKNMERNKFTLRSAVFRGDAKHLLLSESRGRRFDFVDVDPFGTPVPFLIPALLSLRPKVAMLGITATDMPALCGVYPKVAMRKYGGFSIRAPFMHEIAIRLLLGKTFSLGTTYDFAIEPLAILSTDHYIRVWTQIMTSRTKANKQGKQMGYLLYCEGCMHTKSVEISSIILQDDFNHQKEGCSGPIRVAGPLWNGPLYNAQFLDSMKRKYSEEPEIYHRSVDSLLELMIAEQNLVVYPYIDIHWLCDHSNLTPPKRESVMEELQNSGFKSSRTHFQPTAIRTNAPIREVEDIIRRLTGV